MSPLYTPGMRILVWRWFRLLKPGDVVVLSDPRDGRRIVKRVEKILDGDLEEKYHVLGDNKNESTDSRVFGPVSKESILGKVVWHG